MKFVVRDDATGYYVGENSIAYDKQTGRYTYNSSPNFTHGYPATTIERAESIHKNLMERVKDLDLDRTWHIEEIDIRQVMSEENKRDTPKYPFVKQAIRKIEEIA